MLRFTHKKTHTLSSRGLLLDDDVDVEGTPAAVTREIMRGEAQVRREMAKVSAGKEMLRVVVADLIGNLLLTSVNLTNAVRRGQKEN